MAQNVRTARRSSSARKVKRQLSSAEVHILASFNNTIVTVTDLQGNTVCWASAGSAGFKGSRKSTPFAARLAAKQVMKTAQQMGVQEVDLSSKDLVLVVNLQSVPFREWALKSVPLLT